MTEQTTPQKQNDMRRCNS